MMKSTSGTHTAFVVASWASGTLAYSDHIWLSPWKTNAARKFEAMETLQLRLKVTSPTLTYDRGVTDVIRLHVCQTIEMGQKWIFEYSEVTFFQI